MINKKLSKVVKKVVKKVKKATKKGVVAGASVAVVNVNAVKILASIVHPNKKILAEKILSNVPVEELVTEYGKTRVSEMNTYIKSFTANLEKNAALNAKRGCNGVCVACSK